MKNTSGEDRRIGSIKTVLIGLSISAGGLVIGQPAPAEQIKIEAEAGRFQAVATTLPDGTPGLWVLDTTFGRVALCSYESMDASGGVTSGGVAWSVSDIMCTAFQVPESGPWDRYQQE